MIPVVTPARMAEIDAAAPEPTDVLIERAGEAVARAAAEVMGGRLGRRVVVLAGPGNNGADGRAAARRLRRRGARVRDFSAIDAPETLPAADLYIDAAFGTGLSRPYTPPQRGRLDTPVLAVDIPSGLDGLTGDVTGRPGVAGAADGHLRGTQTGLAVRRRSGRMRGNERRRHRSRISASTTSMTAP